MEAWLEEAATLATTQLGLVTWSQLIADDDANPSAITSLLARGWLERIRPRVYAFAGTPRTWEQQLLAAILSVGDGACGSHSCAAELWDFVHLPYLTMEVSVARTRRARLAGVAVHRVTALDPKDVTHRNAIPVTTFG